MKKPTGRPNLKPVSQKQMLAKMKGVNGDQRAATLNLELTGRSVDQAAVEAAEKKADEFEQDRLNRSTNAMEQINKLQVRLANEYEKREELTIITEKSNPTKLAPAKFKAKNVSLDKCKVRIKDLEKKEAKAIKKLTLITLEHTAYDSMSKDDRKAKFEELQGNTLTLKEAAKKMVAAIEQENALAKLEAEKGKGEGAGATDQEDKEPGDTD